MLVFFSLVILFHAQVTEQAHIDRYRSGIVIIVELNKVEDD